MAERVSKCPVCQKDLNSVEHEYQFHEDHWMDLMFVTNPEEVLTKMINLFRKCWEMGS